MYKKVSINIQQFFDFFKKKLAFLGTGGGACGCGLWFSLGACAGCGVLLQCRAYTIMYAVGVHRPAVHRIAWRVGGGVSLGLGLGWCIIVLWGGVHFLVWCCGRVLTSDAIIRAVWGFLASCCVCAILRACRGFKCPLMGLYGSLLGGCLRGL